MSSDQSDSGATPPGSNPPRRPPTIDLKATEVASAKPDAGAEAAPEQQETESASVPPSASNGARPFSGFIAPALGALFGACLALAAGAAVWKAGLLAPERTGPDPELSARLSRIEAQLRDAPKPAPPVDPRILDGIAARLAKIEGALSSQPQSFADPSLAGRVTDAEAVAKVMADETSSLRGRLDEITSLVRDAQHKADAAASAAEAAQKSSQSANAELVRAAQPDDRASRLAAAANALRAAVDRSEPFTAELNTAKSLAPDAASLSPLEPFAAKGIAPASALARELTSLIPALLKASSPLPANASFLEKLQANAERVVRVRPVGDVAGSDPASIVARIENRAAQSDIDGALIELASLPANVRAPADTWIKTAGKRKAAIAASRQFARDALAALGKPSL